jgi:hypothetical protein
MLSRILGRFSAPGKLTASRRSLWSEQVVEAACDSVLEHGVIELPRPQGCLADSAGNPLTERPGVASYFLLGGVYHQAIEQTRAAKGGTLGKVAVIGLGMGSLACHARAGEAWDFLEIDPEVVRIARDRQMFRSFSECTPGARTVVGDGRLTLTQHCGRSGVEAGRSARRFPGVDRRFLQHPRSAAPQARLVRSNASPEAARPRLQMEAIALNRGASATLS